MHKLKVRNYQSIADAEVEVEGFTVLVGPTNVGKSSIVRAFKGMIDNQGGDAFIRAGEVTTEVELLADDLHLKWRKGVDSGYHVNHKGVVDDYTSLGKGQPDFISDLGFGEIRVGQHRVRPQIGPQWPQSPFLLLKPGAVIAEAVSSVTGIDKVPPAIRAAEKHLRQYKSEQKVRQSDLQEAMEEVQSYSTLQRIEDAFSSVNEQTQRVTSLTRSRDQVRDLCARLYREKDTLSSLKDIESVDVPSVDALLRVSAEIDGIRKRVVAITEAADQVRTLKHVSDVEVPAVTSDLIEEVGSLRRLSDGLHLVKEEVSCLKGVGDISVPVDLVSDLMVEVRSLRSLSQNLELAKREATGLKSVSDLVVPADTHEVLLQEVRSLRKFVTNLDWNQANIDQLSRELEEVTATYESATVEYREQLGDVCPLCDQEIRDESHVHHPS